MEPHSLTCAAVLHEQLVQIVVNNAAERAHCATGKSLAASRELTTFQLAADDVPVALCVVSPVLLRVISAWLLSSLFSAAVCLAFDSSPSVLASVSKLLPSPQLCTVNAHFRPSWTPVRSNRVSCMSLQWQHHTTYTFISFHFITYSLGCGASSDSSDILA